MYSLIFMLMKSKAGVSEAFLRLHSKKKRGCGILAPSIGDPDLVQNLNPALIWKEVISIPLKAEIIFVKISCLKNSVNKVFSKHFCISGFQEICVTPGNLLTDISCFHFFQLSFSFLKHNFTTFSASRCHQSFRNVFIVFCFCFFFI